MSTSDAGMGRDMHPNPPHPLALPCHRCQRLPSRILPLAPLLILGLV
jgi:hypothetical protein